jgi:uncharacterized Zn-binding protein involved in type VI secretion
MPPAARITDLHTCPMITPAVPPIPHVGGPIVGPGCPTVLIGSLPAAVVGDTAICVGPPDLIVHGSSTLRPDPLGHPPRTGLLLTRQSVGSVV